MKIPSTIRPRRGFTLIELLVVIAIIMILAAAGFAVGAAALNKARKLKAQSAATAIDQAVNAFYSEYGTFPVQGNASTINTASNTYFLQTLLGDNPDLNTRGMSFLSVKEGKAQGAGGMDGLVYDGSNAVRGLYDPWGNGYVVEMDTAFEEFLEFTPTGIQGATEIRLNGRRVAVYSIGVFEDDTATLSTMVKTW